MLSNVTLESHWEGKLGEGRILALTWNFQFENASWKYPLWTEVLRGWFGGHGSDPGRTEDLRPPGESQGVVGEILGDGSCGHPALPLLCSSATVFFSFFLSLSLCVPPAPTPPAIGNHPLLSSP